MQLRSLGYRTDLIFPRFDGEVEARDKYVVARSPSNPGYFFGNLLFFGAPPERGGHDGIDAWITAFKREFAEHPRVAHVTFCWEGGAPGAEAEAALIARGYKIEKSVILSTDRVNPPPKPNRDINVRTILSDSDWEEVIRAQVTSRSAEFDPERYLVFKREQFQRYRKMAEAGLGDWYGAYVGGALAADLGVFFDHGLGRFQSVETHPDFRRRGICGTLVHAVSSDALARGRASRLVMAADPDYHAAKVYESVGFKPTENLWAAYWYPRDEWSAS